eukprot:gene32007-38700_t
MKSIKELTKLYKNSRCPALPLSKDEGVLLNDKPKLEALTGLSSLHPVKDAIDGYERGIAICVVIVDELYHEEIWKAWLATNSSSQSASKRFNYHAELFIHAKYPDRIQSEWVKRRTLPFSFSPYWNSPEVVRAMVALLHEATTSHETTKEYHRFIFATESCIPCSTLGELGDALMEDEKSWLDAYNIPQTRYEAGYCFDSVDQTVIPRKAVWKSLPGWVCLTRRHALEILTLIEKTGGYKKGIQYTTPRSDKPLDGGENTSDLIDAFGAPGQWYEGKGGVHAPEEVFFPTMLALLGYLRSNGEDEVLRRRVNYAEWKKRSDANPITYPALTPQLYATIRSSGSLLGRKFARGGTSVDTWMRIVASHSSSSTRLNAEESKEGEGGSKNVGEKRTLSAREADDTESQSANKK